MIRLLRKIRQKLLSDKSYGVYVLYASGEVALVVIGILLALQIDNWNEERKLKEEEINILQDFVESINEDLADFTWPLAINPTVSTSINVIVEAM